MEKSIKKLSKNAGVDRFLFIIAKRLGIHFQPNFGSSFYKLPPKKMICKDQKDWKMPVGTIRLSDHWNYENIDGMEVFVTDVLIESKKWAICINTGNKACPWKVLKIFKNGDSIYSVSNKLIETEIKNILK